MSLTSVFGLSPAEDITFFIDHASLAQFDLLSNLPEADCLKLVGTEGWFATEKGLNAYCGKMYLLTWPAEPGKVVKLCDGQLEPPST